MRDAFSTALVRMAQQDPRVLLLTGDHGYALFDDFRRCCPSQYINAGIAEQNMVGVAAGLARMGFRPFVYGLSAFVPVRVVEQIKLDVAHDNLPVIFIGDGAGFVYSHLGTSHQSTEDIACLRAIPQMTILSPADRYEVTLCMELALSAGAPVYFRMGKSDRGDVHRTVPDAAIGELIPLQTGSPGGFAILATGSMVRDALTLAEEHVPGTAVWSVPSIKPIDEDRVATICAQSRGVVVLEEHNVQGGLGGLIAEIATDRAPVRILRLGVSDRFSHYCGTYQYLLREHGLDFETLRQRIQTFVTAS